jgi:ABC-2 type transport system permease protein
LWDLLGVEVIQKSRRGLFGELDSDYAVVWQNFKPAKFSGIDQLTPEYVFISQDAPHSDESFEPFNEKSPITAGLQELILPLPGGLLKRNAASTDFLPLIKTGNNTGLIMVKDLMSARAALDIRSREGSPTNEEYAIAAYITGKPKISEDEEDSAKAKGESKSAAKDVKSEENKDGEKAKAGDQKTGNGQNELNVVLVADADMLASLFFDSRARRSPDNELQIDTDNVTFVLNALDVLAGDLRFVPLRNKRPMHRPLESIVEQTQQARDKTEAALNEYKKASQEQEAKLEQDLKNTKESLEAELQKLQQQENSDPKLLQEKGIDLSLQLQVAERRKEATVEHLRQTAKRQIEKADSELMSSVRSVQDNYKLKSVIYPPILPLAVAFFVYFYRRSKEREGVSKARLR